MVLTFVPVIKRPWRTSGEANLKRDTPVGRDRNALRDEHELGGDSADDHGAVAEYGRSEVLLGKFSRQMQRLGVDPLDVARRVDFDRERGEHDHAQGCGDEYADAECPQQFGPENPALVQLVRGV